MDVDVLSETTIARPRTEVAAFAADPDNATAWYRNITDVEWISSRPLAVGAAVRFTAQFLGRRLVYTYEVRDFVPLERLVMATADGPFAMETTYRWSDSTGGGTHMTLRNRGTPTGFVRLTAPLLESAMRRANRADLARLKAALEQG